MRTFIYFLLALPHLIVNIQAQNILINEILASNSTIISDEDGDYSDWIELYNNQSGEVDLTGFGLSDDPAAPFKWIFPSVTLAANDHLLVFASEKNINQYIRHWETVINWGDDWKYRLGTSEPLTSWKNLGFDDQTWQSGSSGFGYGDNDDSTIVSASINSIYIRKTFSVDDVNNIAMAMLHVDYDDAFVAYLNGVEIARANIGTNNIPPAYNASADTYVEPVLVYGGRPKGFTIQNVQSVLQNGENVVAIQVHNYGTGSSDLTLIPFLSLGMNTVPPNPNGTNPLLDLPNKYLHTNFKLSSDGETLTITHSQGNLIDQISYPSLSADISFGRQPDGGNSWYFFPEATPDETNSTQGYLGVTVDPDISLNGGFYSSPINVSINSGSVTDTVYFTLNGSEPIKSSEIYKSPIQISSTTVLRVRAFSQGFLPSKIITNTYLMNFTAQLPVVSLSTNPENFFDEETGIYTYGDSAETSFPYFGANFWKDWEKPVHVELFDNNDNGFNIDAGVQIFGGWSRGHAQKSLAIFARGQYGYSTINNKLFDDLPFTEYQAFILRNSGNDWTSTMFRDGLMTSLVQGTDIDKQDFKPAIVFLNGVYWGIHNIREKVNEHYLAQHHNVNPDSLDILEIFGEVIQGDNEDYLSLYSFIETNSLTIPSNYEFVKNKIDVKNFIRYHISQIYFANTDWPGGNIKYWRNGKNGKWKWIMFDTDFGFGLYDSDAYKHNTLEFATATNGPDWPNPPWSTLFLRKLLENQSFKNDFINCFADFSNSIFNATVVNSKINELRSKIETEIPRHAQRWHQFDYNGWVNNVQYLRNFANQRITYMQLHFVQRFGLTGLAPVNLTIPDTSMGSVLLNSITIKSPTWSGSYFLGVPISIIAQPKNGFRFVRWEGTFSSGEDTLVINLSGGTNLKAVFEVDSNFALHNVVINEINYNSSASFNPEDWIELYNNEDTVINLSGWTFKDSDDAHVFTIPQGIILNPGSYLVLCIDTALFKPLFDNVNNYIGNVGFGLSGNGELIRLYDDKMNMIDSLVYDDVSPWPTQPDGNGPTLSLKNPDIDNSLAENWAASLSTGTPGKVNDVLTNIESEPEPPTDFSLEQNYPNPFNPSTIIGWQSPVSSWQTLKIYDVLGNEVVTLVDEYKPAGKYEVEFQSAVGSRQFASGVYYYQLKINDFIKSKKMILIK